MFGELNATAFEFSSVFYNAEFEDVLSKIVTCYQLMLCNNVKLPNDENGIRDILLLNYLKNNEIRNSIGLTNYLFNREVPEDVGIGRTDIKIETANTFTDTSAYYTIECKRIDSVNLAGSTGLNAKYIEYGICRFVNNVYTCHYLTNGMIGFIVEKIDINENIKHINNLLKNRFTTANTIGTVEKRLFISDFDFSYFSRHTNCNRNEITIYHLMLDFSRCML